MSWVELTPIGYPSCLQALEREGYFFTICILGFNQRTRDPRGSAVRIVRVRQESLWPKRPHRMDAVLGVPEAIIHMRNVGVDQAHSVFRKSVSAQMDVLDRGAYHRERLAV